jgi:hypothetical protein
MAWDQHAPAARDVGEINPQQHDELGACYPAISEASRIAKRRSHRMQPCVGLHRRADYRKRASRYGLGRII